MARDDRIKRPERDPRPAEQQQDLTISERVQLLVSDVLGNVTQQLEQKHSQASKTDKR